MRLSDFVNEYELWIHECSSGTYLLVKHHTSIGFSGSIGSRDIELAAFKSSVARAAVSSRFISFGRGTQPANLGTPWPLR